MPPSSLAPAALLRLSFKLCAWVLAFAIAAMTVGPIGLRPHVAPLGIERGGAFFLLGLFLALAYPRRTWLAISVAVGGAALLEYLQRIVPGRHGQWDDLAVKAVGGLAGVILALTLLALYRRFR